MPAGTCWDGRCAHLPGAPSPHLSLLLPLGQAGTDIESQSMSAAVRSVENQHWYCWLIGRSCIGLLPLGLSVSARKDAAVPGRRQQHQLCQQQQSGPCTALSAVLGWRPQTVLQEAGALLPGHYLFDAFF